MSSGLSLPRRVWQRFMKPTYFVGRDLQGNEYYEYPNANNGRPKRTVQYKQTDDMWTYIASGKRLPVQWTAWLTHTRSSPPSVEELQADLARQHRVRMNAATLEARDKEERERVACTTRPSHPQVLRPHAEKEQTPPAVKLSHNNPTPVANPWAEAKRGPDEPQSWNPVVRRR